MKTAYQRTADLQSLTVALLRAVIEQSDTLSDDALCAWLQEAPVVAQLRTLDAADVAYVRAGMRKLLNERTD